MERKQSAVLFSDICGSTSYFEKHGEVMGGKMVRAYRRIVGDALVAQGGELHPVADTMVALFATADALVMAGTAAHTALASVAPGSLVPGGPAEPLRIHSGAAFGTIVVEDSGEVFGDVMNVAARICDLAGPDQFYATKALTNRVTNPTLAETRRIGSFPVRGKSTNLEVFEILWAKEGITARASKLAPAEESWLEVRFGDQVVRLTPEKPKLTLGRDTTNDVVVTDRAASRAHAEVVHRRGRCYLVDRSTNGTFLRPGRRKPHHLHREELLLEGEGTFSLGRADGPPVAYRVV